MDGPARVMSVTRIQRATPSTGGRNLRIISEQPPLRGALSLCFFLFGQAKRKKVKEIKNFSSAERARRARDIEDGFCVSTLEKEGTTLSKAVALLN